MVQLDEQHAAPGPGADGGGQQARPGSRCRGGARNATPSANLGSFDGGAQTWQTASRIGGFFRPWA